MSKTIIVGGDIHHKHKPVELFLKRANRHGLISGATGTGKTVSLQVLAERFSQQGVPVFAVDVKGDLSGIAKPGTMNEHIKERIEHIGLKDFKFQGNPTIFWDLYGERGHPIRTTISDMGPILLSRLLDLTPTQDALLHIAFRIADENGWLMIDLDDLDAMLNWMEENKEELEKKYGRISSSSIGAIRRGLMVLRDAGGDLFFGEPALDLRDLMRTTFDGRGVISILDAKKLISDARLYSTFLLWLLSELFEQLPEVGDPEKPKLVFFFDEAHLLFRDSPKILLEKIEQVVRLIRSKGVGIYFVTQNPLDIPETIRSQLGNKIQHALRAFTPKDQKAIKMIAQTFRPNPEVDVERALTDMKVGVALTSFLDEKGRPQPVVETLMAPPMSRIGPITDEERQQIIKNSPIYGLYEKRIDRISAEEILEKLNEEKLKRLEEEKQKAEQQKDIPFWQELLFGNKKKAGFVQTVTKAVVKEVSKQVSKKITKTIIRGIFGNLLK